MSETKKYNILIVDDEHTNSLALIHILKHEYNVFAEKCGQDAIEAVEENVPDIILLDILMPEMDGYKVLSLLKSSDKTKNIPVIIITRLSGTDDEKKGLVLGAADYITKPFIPEIIELRVRNQIKMLEQLRAIERFGMIDQLTELPNRRSFDTRFKLEWGRASREKEPISILVIDIDYFKSYNDTHGHQQGDVALQLFAKVFSSTLKRPGDFAARWGGEEFIALLPNTDVQGAIAIAEQIRKSVEEMVIPLLEGQGQDGCMVSKITASIGANTKEYGNNITVNEFFSAADKALYVAKNKGRNRVCHFSTPD